MQTSPEYFEAQAKINMLPASFFDDESEWFYEVTLVDGPLNSRLGSQRSAGKAKFFRTSNALMAVDVNIPEEQKNLSGEKLPKVMQVPVSWTDDLVRSGSTALLEENSLVMRMSALRLADRKWGLFDFKRINNITSKH